MSEYENEETSQIINLKAYRQVKAAAHEDLAYQAMILKMTKLELLDEMVRFQEERSSVGELTLPMMVRGKVLFSALEKSAETQELKLLTGSYRRHLEFELQEYVRNRQVTAAE